MNRRELLRGLAAGGLIVAGELWVPGQKLISIPSGNRLMTMDEISREALKTLESKIIKTGCHQKPLWPGMDGGFTIITRRNSSTSA